MKVMRTRADQLCLIAVRLDRTAQLHLRLIHDQTSGLFAIFPPEHEPEKNTVRLIALLITVPGGMRRFLNSTSSFA